MSEDICPEFPFFGASYPDATCIDGKLWDLDSCDEPKGPLYNGGEFSCPFCNPKDFAKEYAEYQYSEEENSLEKAYSDMNKLRKQNNFKEVTNDQ